MLQSTDHGRTVRRPYIIAAAITLALGVGLLLDLANQGLAWRAIYNVTGEESIPGQAVGVLEFAGRAFRPQPDLAPYAPVDHAGTVPFGVNVFLEQEVEIEKRERTVAMAKEAGFLWLRQEFPWEDIEIHGRGDFEDRRNDRNGDGMLDEADAISAWDKYDNIVDIVEQHDMRLMVRLSNPPSWTHASNDAGDKGPPDDLDDYINFVAAVGERYRGRITHYQIWNEPNIYPEWGNRDVNALDYTEMLCRSYEILKAIDPEIVVVSGAIAPTVSMDFTNLNDFIYLEVMFNAGAGACFDVLAMQGYGLNSGPTDRRLRATTVNYNRVLHIRDLMVNHGLAEKPIWISEAAWNPVPPEVPDISGRETFGVVTEEQAARYMVRAYERQQEEWPYTGVMFYWFFKRASDTESNQSWYYFRLTEPNFTPLPIYDALRDYTSTLTPTLYRGGHQADDHWAVALADDAETVTAAGAQFNDATQTDSAVFVADGTQVAVRWQGGPLTLQWDERNTITLDDNPAADGWNERRVRLGWWAAPHTISLTGDALLLDSITVYDNSTRDYALLFGMMLAVVGVLGFGLRRTR